MIIKQTRIHNIDAHTGIIPPGDDVVIGVVNPSAEQLARIGFPAMSENGDSILPAVLGSTSEFNAEGKEIVHRDQPMETASRTVDWHWIEWHGRERVPKRGFRSVSYKRYPRSFSPPPSIELTIATDAEGNCVVRTPVIKDWRNSKDAVVHATNLMLELFGESSFFDGSMKHLITAPIKRLNWKVFPAGQRSFIQLQQELEPVLAKVPGGNRAFTEHRLEQVNLYKPEFAAVGQGGFRGYVIFGFPARNTYVLESILYGNATYIFGEHWEELSKKTKAEILDQNLQKKRIVHHPLWAKDLSAALK